ncbi:MAG: hypothetical protein KFH87_14535 [Bacteroidetes bacterium]|nr:hypothetical protein [Bacteroidota bacterium]
MKHISFILSFFLVLAASAAAQEYRGVSLEFMVDNGEGREQVLTVGVREGATTGLDPMMEEAELPPQPPNEIFDTRLVSTPGKSQLGLGSLNDYRPYPMDEGNIVETYTIAYQAGINATGVTLYWAEQPPSRVRAVMIDSEDQTGKTSYEAPFASGQIVVEVTFNPSALSFTATPSPLLFDVNNIDPLPTRMLTITPEGDSQAEWMLDTDVEWIEMEPSHGEGEQSVDIMVNTRLLPEGSYEGTIFIRSPSDQTSLEVPVRMNMVVNVKETPVAGGIYLGQNYPNPFGSASMSGNASTRIDLDLGSRSVSTAPSLRVYDMLGREVMDLSHHLQVRDGLQSVRFDAAALPGGMYTYTLRYGDVVHARGMILSK